MVTAAHRIGQAPRLAIGSAATQGALFRQLQHRCGRQRIVGVKDVIQSAAKIARAIREKRLACAANVQSLPQAFDGHAAIRQRGIPLGTWAAAAR